MHRVASIVQIWCDNKDDVAVSVVSKNTLFFKLSGDRTKRKVLQFFPLFLKITEMAKSRGAL